MLALFCTTPHAMTRLFYLERTNSPTHINQAKSGFDSFAKNYNGIDILIPQAYQVDQNGIVWGDVDPHVYTIAKTHAIKIMPLVTNAKFDKEKTHDFFQNDAAQLRAIESIIKTCKQYQFYGIQFDFENMRMEDKDHLTHFYTLAAKKLHDAGFVVSFALPPVLPDDPISSLIQKKFYENWEAAYDFPILGKISDFVTIMAYNQHGQGTTPGPSADVRWVDATLQYAMKYIPADKISLGIPAWSDYWFTDRLSETNQISSKHIGMNYNDLMYLLEKWGGKLQWDDEAKVSYHMFSHQWLNQYVFVEDAKSFKAKQDLVEKYHLAGISVFALGMEDPKIWTQLTKQK